MGQKKDNDLFLQVLPLFNAMGDKTRQEIMLLLAHHNRLSVGELTKYTHLSRPAVSHHIKVLRDAELITEQREGTKRYYQPTFTRYVEPMRKIIELVDTHERGYDKTKGESNGE